MNAKLYRDTRSILKRLSSKRVRRSPLSNQKKLYELRLRERLPKGKLLDVRA